MATVQCNHLVYNENPIRKLKEIAKDQKEKMLVNVNTQKAEQRDKKLKIRLDRTRAKHDIKDKGDTSIFY